MKKLIVFTLVFSLFTYGVLLNKSNVYADEIVSVTKINNEELIMAGDSTEMHDTEETRIEPYSVTVTVAAAITYLTYYCILYCQHITNFINKLNQTHGMSNVVLTKSLWLSYSNFGVMEKNVTPKSSQNSWNAPNGCVWSGPTVGGQWLCPYFLKV